MKIVKFKNGKYGVRRFSIFSIGFEFLGSQSECWFSFQGGILRNCQFNSIEKCNEVIAAHKKIIEAKKKDIGKAI